MPAHVHTLQIGDIRVTVLNDAIRPAPLERTAQYLSVSPEAVREAYETLGLDVEKDEHHFNCLLIQSGDETVLVDAGFGEQAQPQGGNLFEGLAKMGLGAEDITRVVITHAHGDHVLGLVDELGNMKFPGVDHHFNQLEWAYWYVEGNLQGEGRKPLEVVRENVVLFEAGDDIIPGVKTVPAYGHTPGHTGLMIESNGERLLCAVDILHRRAQFVHPEWSMSFDTDTSVSVPTRRQVLQQAADENLLMHLYHMPFPGLGYVSVEGEGFRWEPIE